MDAVLTEPEARREWLRRLAVSVLVLAFSGVLAGVSSWLIQALYPDRPRPPDLLFDLFPYWPWMQWGVEALYVTGIILLAVYAFRGRVDQIPEIITLFGLMEIFRAVIIILTPLATPMDEAARLGLPLVRNWGEFPSGHAATVLLFYLIVDRDDAPRLKTTMGVIVVAECITLIISHSHYTIDVIGGLLLAYFIYWEWTRGHIFDWLKRYVTAQARRSEAA
jgi:membrane-associated phospholipid phosphatase